MKALKKRKGVTLVEVLISLVLIGVITAGLLTFFASGYHNILRQRGQNMLNFDIQQDFETRLADIKKNSGHGTEVETFTYRVGNGNSQSIKVTGQTLSYNKNKQTKNIHLFAANARESVLQIPDDLDVSIPTSKRFYYVGDTTPRGVVGLTDNQQNSKARIYTESGWFLSDRSIGPTTPGVVPVGTIGQAGNTVGASTVLPEMPADFHQTSKLDTGVRITDDMRGRYLTFAARAINSYGRVGNYQEADRIWVMGLPVTSNLLLHTDADLALAKVGNTTTTIPTTDQPQTNTDVRNYFKNTAYGGTIPVLNYQEPIIHQARQLIALGGRTMQFSGQRFGSHTTAILIGNRQQTGPLLTYQLNNTMTWRLSLENDGKIAVETVDNSKANNGGREIVREKEQFRLDYKKDNSIQVRSSTANNILTLEVFVNGTLSHTQQLYLNRNGVTHDINNGILYFGGNTYINEFAVYSSKLSDADMGKIVTYFKDKYEAK